MYYEINYRIILYRLQSRQHAEVWEANTKTSRLLYRYSSYGVDLRQKLQQLRPEGLESEPYELKSDDIVVCTSLVTSQPCLMRFGLVIRNRHRRRRQQDDHPPQRRRTRGAASTPTRPTRLPAPRSRLCGSNNVARRPLVQGWGLGVMGGGTQFDNCRIHPTCFSRAYRINPS